MYIYTQWLINFFEQKLEQSAEIPELFEISYKISKKKQKETEIRAICKPYP